MYKSLIAAAVLSLSIATPAFAFTGVSFQPITLTAPAPLVAPTLTAPKPLVAPAFPAPTPFKPFTFTGFKLF